MTQMIPLLDLGNVIIKVDFSPFCEWVKENSPITDLEKIASFHKSSLYFDYEFGNISTEEFIARMGNMYDTKFNEAEFQKRFCSIFPSVIEGASTLLEELEERGVYCLSNTNAMHFDHLMEALPEMKKFRKVFASHQIGKRKPYPGTYREVAKALELAPQNLVFFDDVAANVEGARRAGLEAHLFESCEQVRSLLS